MHNQKSTIIVGLLLIFVVFYAFDIDVVLFYPVPEAPLIDTQQFRGPYLDTPCFS